MRGWRSGVESGARAEPAEVREAGAFAPPPIFWYSSRPPGSCPQGDCHETYEVEIYDGAGHAFMRQADDPEGSPAAKKARDDAWARIERILSSIG